MKKLFITAVLTLFVGVSSYAQKAITHFGLEGGISVNNFSDFKNLGNGMLGWHAGMSFLTKLPCFFALQPTVIYERSNAKVALPDGGAGNMKVDAINIPIAVQWGPDLGICRIYAEAVPFVGFNIGGKFQKADIWENVKDYLKTTQFGVGAGLGVDIWRFQLNARYNWSFGDWATITEGSPFKDLVGKKKGLMVTLAYFFN